MLNNSVHDHLTRSCTNIHLKKHKLSLGQSTSAYKNARLRDTFSEEIKNANCVQTFKTHLFTVSQEIRIRLHAIPNRRGFYFRQTAVYSCYCYCMSRWMTLSSLLANVGSRSGVPDGRCMTFIYSYAFLFLYLM